MFLVVNGKTNVMETAQAALSVLSCWLQLLLQSAAETAARRSAGEPE